ncbi:MAG: hypothetical protein K5777_01600 [Nitrosopumilus sp.]|nr:hypothetical protein [Nitrosopumilus sp.]
MLKVVFVMMLMAGSLIMPANALTTSEFGYKLHPEKLLENTTGDLQIFAISNDIMIPKNIQNLKAISSDTNIIKILEVEEDSEKVTKNIKIKAIKPGIATIVLAAPGFSSKEISLEVFNNNNYPTQILMKVTPDSFSVDGPKYGYVAVELATTGGLPTIAEEDVIVYVETPNTDVIELRNSEIVISQGKYFGIIEFDIVGSGDAVIFADTEGMKKVSENVEILEAEGPLEIQLTIIPKTFNSFSGAKGYAIAQLVDAKGIPVASEEDIMLELGVENPDVSMNTSHDFEEVLFDQNRITIKKGEYSAYTKFTPRPNLADFSDSNQQTFDMFISVDNYLARGDTFTVLHDEIGGLEGEGPSITEAIPFLTTGKEEIIGVTYFETDIEVSRQIGGSTQGNTNRQLVTVTVPVMAKNDFELNISSSDSNTVDAKNSIMKKSENVVLIKGNTGTMTSDSNVELYITDNDGVKTVSALPNGPVEDDIDLKTEPLIPMVLSGYEFPILGYLVESTEEDSETTTTEDEEEEKDPRLGPTLFVKDGFLTFSANELVNIESVKVFQNQEYALSYPIIEEVGSTTLNAQIGKFTGSMALTSHTTDPTAIHLGYIDNMLVNEINLGTIQLLDSVGNPVYAKENTTIQLVSNDESILKIPEQITIQQGEYFNTFEIEPKGEGVAEIAILSENLPLSKYDISVIDISPILSLDLGGTMNWNDRIEAKLSISIPEIETALNGYQVEWITEGGEIRSIDKETNTEGVAILNIIANDMDTVSITAKVTGNGISENTISKSAKILNMPVIEEVVETTETTTEFPLDMTVIVLIIIPVGIAGALLFLKRTDRLDLITEKIPIGDKLNLGDRMEEIKEKISDIRNR